MKEIIQKLASDGKMFSIKFTKLNGEERNMVARLGVTKYVKGTKAGLVSNDRLVVFDMHKKWYRTINTSEVKSIKCKGVEFKISE